MIDGKINTRRLNQLFTSLRKKADNTAPVMLALSKDMQSAVDDTFEQEGRQPKWKRLKPSTIKQRIRQNRWPGRILQRSGADGLVNNINKAHTNDTATVGTDRDYAPYLQHGTKKMVARPFIKFIQSDVKQWEDTVTNYLTRGFN